MQEAERTADSSTQRDEELVRDFQSGDADAFSVLVTRYMHVIRSRTARFNGLVEREDLVQEGLLGLFLAARTFSETGGASFSTYAYRCVENRILDAVRRSQSSKNKVLNDAIPLEEIEAQDFSADPETLLEGREALRRLLTSGNFSALERRALQLYLGGYKRSELERVFGAPVSTYDNALARVRRKLLGR